MNFEQWKQDLEERWSRIKDAWKNTHHTGEIDAAWREARDADDFVRIEDEVAAKVFNPHSDGGGFCIDCPLCGFFCVHVVSAYARRGKDEYEGNKGYRGVQTKGTTNDRRDALCISVDGECGHCFNIIFQQSKGVEGIAVEVRQKDLDEVKKESKKIPTNA